MKPVFTSASNMRRLRSAFIGSISAWLPSRRSELHQTGTWVMTLDGQVRSAKLDRRKGAVLLGRVVQHRMLLMSSGANEALKPAPDLMGGRAELSFWAQSQEHRPWPGRGTTTTNEGSLVCALCAQQQIQAQKGEGNAKCGSAARTTWLDCSRWGRRAVS
mgnify:CR=1 FL=1